MKTCLKCGRIFDSGRRRSENDGNCPYPSCSGKVIEIDDNIVRPIQILNKEGYPTNESCAGHIWGGNPYILFDKIVYAKAFSSLPFQFESTIDYQSGGLRIYRIVSSNSEIERFRLLNVAAQDLLEWASSVPPAVEMLVQFNFEGEKDPFKSLEMVEKELHLFDLSKFDIWEGIQYQTGVNVSTERFEEIYDEIESYAEDRDFEVKVFGPTGI